MSSIDPVGSGNGKIIFQGIAKEDDLIAKRSAAEVEQANKASAFVAPSFQISGGTQSTLFAFSIHVEKPVVGTQYNLTDVHGLSYAPPPLASKAS